MDHTRRELLGAASALVVTAGCLGGGDTTATPTEDPTTATATGTARPTHSETPTEEPTEKPTEEQTPTGESSIRLWPTGLTAVFDGDVGSDAILDALDGPPGSMVLYGGQRGGERVTYFLSLSSSLYVSEASSAFEAADGLSLRQVFRGVGPSYRQEYAAALGEQAAERAGIDPESVSLTPGRLGDHQFLDVSAPTNQSALVPMLPDLALRRANGGSEERILGPGGVDVDGDFAISQRRAGMTEVQFSLTEAGIESFAAAVGAASDEELRGDFFRPVVDGEAFRAFSLTESFATAVQNGEWDGTLSFSVQRRSGAGPAISRLTGGLPPVPFQFEPSTD